MKESRFVWAGITFAGFLGATLVGPTVALNADAANGPQLQERLKIIVEQETSGNQTAGSLSRIETAYLKELEMAASDDDRLLIYADLVRLYVNDGIRQPAKVAQYASKALEVAVSPVDKCRLYVSLGGARERMRKEPSTAMQRRESLLPYLQGLEIARTNRHVETVRELPNIDLFDGPENTNDPVYQAMDRRWQEQVAARAEVVQQNDLIGCEERILSAIAFMYQPQDEDALRRDAKEILQDEGAVRTLILSVQKHRK
jgi:hypothetical protein